MKENITYDSSSELIWNNPYGLALALLIFFFLTFEFWALITVMGFNALFRAKKHVLYIQALELENKRLKEKFNELRLRWHSGEGVEDLRFESVGEKHFYVKQDDPTPAAWQEHE